MSAVGQVRGRTSRATRGNKPGYKLTEIAVAFGASAVFSSNLDVTLNGTDVSALGDQTPRYPRAWDPNSYSVAQASAPLQPLSTGAPVYGNQTSIAFTLANNDSLARAATNLIGTGDKTFFSVHRLRTSLAGLQMIFSNESVATTAGMGIGYNTGVTREIHNAAVTNELFGNASLVAAEVWCCRKFAGVLATATVNNTPTVVGGGNTNDSTPGAGAILAIGDIGGTWQSPDMDWLFSALFTRVLSDSVAYMLTKTAGTQIGLTVT